MSMFVHLCVGGRRTHRFSHAWPLESVCPSTLPYQEMTEMMVGPTGAISPESLATQNGLHCALCTGGDLGLQTSLTSLLEDDVDGRSGRDGRDLSDWHENRLGCQLARVGLLAGSDFFGRTRIQTLPDTPTAGDLHHFLPNIFTTTSQYLCTPCFRINKLRAGYAGPLSHCVEAKLL